MKKTLRIINVIEQIDGVVSGIDTFVIPEGITPHSKEEQKIVDIAEKLFIKIAKENGMDEDDSEDALDNGYYETESYKHGGSQYRVCIHWSNETTQEKIKNL